MRNIQSGAFLLGVVLLVFAAGCQARESIPETGVTPPATAAPTVPASAGPTEAAAEASPTADSTAQEEAAAPAAQIDCAPPAAMTPGMTEGPYYTPGSPEDADLADDLPGTRLELSGYVVDGECNPIANAWIDFWQADSLGAYDNAGYTLRGHQYTDENGFYRLTTVVPGEYPGRTEHIHVKLQAPDGPVVTTQMFFPDVAANERDRIFDESLIVQVKSATEERVEAAFTFVIPRE